MRRLTYRSALAGLAEQAISRPTLQVTVAPARALVRWQLMTQSPASLRLEAFELPAQPNASSGHDPCALWLAPSDWLLVSMSLDRDDLLRLAMAAPQEHLGHITDVSHAYQAIVISGSDARDVLAKGCGLDLHRRVFPPGRCARTRFAQIPGLIHHRVPDEFDVYVDRSLAAWLWDWLRDTSSLH